MPENPLLPNAELRSLRQFLEVAEELTAVAEKGDRLRGKRAKSKKDGVVPGSEALLAATLLQLKAGDVIVPEPEDKLIAELLEKKRKRARLATSPQIVEVGNDVPRLHLAAGMAAALRRLEKGGLVLAFIRSATSEPAWAAALQWAQQETLPLIIICGDSSGPDAFLSTSETAEDSLTWDTVEKSARRSQFPVLTVDGQDAVAVYRVMQESVLRARSGAGPALLWTVLPQAAAWRRKERPGETPLGKLDRYLKVRKISFQTRPA